uniref:DNA replication complex GINS protein PSF2 n=1 Tax=Panagrellus redivivus TaxID=6233 RepID=A0A7E4UNT6_PANRE
MDPEQCDFLLGNEPIQIKPKFNEADPFMLIGGEVGPFEAGVPLEVPVWVALELRKRQTCTICQPEWFNLTELRKIKTAEGDSTGFTKIHERFFEMAHLLITQAKDDLENLDEVRTIVRDIWDTRSSKLKTSVIQYFGSTPASQAQMDNITQFEVAYARGFMTDASNVIRKLSDVTNSLPKH